MAEELATAPAAGEDVPAPTGVAPNAEPEIDLGAAEAPDAEDDDAPAPVEASGDEEDEFEEVERGGKKYNLPKSIASELLMQQDYTKKTQDLAQQRQTYEAAQAALSERAKTHEEDLRADIAEHATVHAMSERLKVFANIDWAAWRQTARANDQANGTTTIDQVDDARAEYGQLRDAHAQAEAALKAKTEERAKERTLEQQRTAAEQATADAKLVQEGFIALKRDFPNWSPPEANKTLEFGQKVGGFTVAELNEVRDPRMIKVLHLARLGQEAISQQRATKTAAKVQETVPVQEVKGNAPAKKDMNRMSTDAWMRERNKQLATRRVR